MVETGDGAPSRPLRRDAERNRRRILNAARALVVEAGLDVSHDDIARAADVGVGTVYRRFPDKQKLFDERVDEVVALAESSREFDDPWDGLCGFVVGNLELQAGDQGLKEMMLGTARDTVDPHLWRRALALVLDGYRQGPRPDRLPGHTPSTDEIERILGRWRPPRPRSPTR